LTASSGLFLFLRQVVDRADAQHQAGQLKRAPRGKLGRPVEQFTTHLHQLRAQHELRKPPQHPDRDLAAVRYPIKQCGGGATDIGHCCNALFIPVTVTEMSPSGALPDVFWPRVMWSFTLKKRGIRIPVLQPKSSASANSAILASVWKAVVAPFRVRSKAPSYTRLTCGKNDLRASRFG